MFEAWTATLGFVGAIAFWSSIHVLLFRDRRRASEFRFDKEQPVAPFEWLGQLGGKRLWGAYLPLVAYVGSIKLFHCVVTKAPLPMAPPTALRVLLELCAGVYLYDALFAPIHASMHRRGSPAWWRRLHRTHQRDQSRRGKALVPLRRSSIVRRRRAPGRVQRARAAGAVRSSGSALALLAPKPAVARAPHLVVTSCWPRPFRLRPALDDAPGLAARVRRGEGPRRAAAGRPPLPPASTRPALGRATAADSCFNTAVEGCRSVRQRRRVLRAGAGTAVADCLRDLRIYGA